MRPLREIRADRVLSIRELARQASVAPSTIYLIEAGRTIPQPRVVRQLATALGVDPHEIEEFQRAIEAAKVRQSRDSGRPDHPPAGADPGSSDGSSHS